MPDLVELWCRATAAAPSHAAIAPEDKIKITPEMIEASARVLQENLYEDLRLNLSTAKSVAAQMLEAALNIGGYLRLKSQ